jgi:hypothetical protein
MNSNSLFNSFEIHPLPNRFTKEIRLLVKEDNYLNDRD